MRRLFHERTTQKLTVQALETLAVIAYRQPITAAEITEVRGVNTSGVLNTLLERHLIKIVGRKQVVGRPFMYATTKEFLIRFGLNDLTDLPKVEDMAEALGLDAPILIEQTPSEEMLPLDEPETTARDDRASRIPSSAHEDTEGHEVQNVLGCSFVSFVSFVLDPRASRLLFAGAPDLLSSSARASARASTAVADRPDRDALQVIDRMADRVAHVPHLAVASFADA